VVQIDATALKALTKKERQDETQLITKIDGFLSSNQLNADLIFFGAKVNEHSPAHHPLLDAPYCSVGDEAQLS
jgi:hypothetical protein